jgi:signal transduction histidine kinase
MTHRVELPRGGRLLVLACTFVLLLLVVSWVVVLGTWTWSDHLTGSHVNVATGLLACVSSVYAAVRAHGTLRRAWALIAAMSLLYCGGDVLWAFADDSSGSAALTFADCLYLVGLVPAVAGLLAYPTARGLGRTWLPLTLDGLLLGCSALLTSQVLALGEVARVTSGFDTFVYVVFPITSVLLACLVLALLVRSVGAVRLDVVLLGLGFAAFALGDIGYALLTARGQVIDGTVYELAYAVAPLLLVLAALTAVTFDTSTRVLQRHLSGRLAQLLPDFASVASLGLVVTVGAKSEDLALVAAVLVLTGLRQMNAISHNLRLRHDLERTIADRTEDLALITAEHRRLDAMKREFVSAVSHELRTPLTAIRGSLEMLVDGDVGELPGSARPIVEMATRGSERLSRLVDDIIDLQRLESGTFGLRPAPCDLNALVQDAVDSLAPLSREAGVQVLVVPLPVPAPGQVECDSDRVTQALVNLLGNALKFTAPGGAVTVSVVLEREAVQVSVADTGRGIPAGELEAIFTPFHQVDADEARQQSGTGLGLSITQRIVEAHGGSIWAQSEPGRGSAFHFTLPLPSSAADRPSRDDDHHRHEVADAQRHSELTGR